jgi:glycosyltransferase involved in cell wall biosynthesis
MPGSGRGRRVLFVVHKSYPIGEVRVQREAEAASRAGWRVTVLSLAVAGRPPSEMVNNVRVIRTSVRHDRRWNYGGLLWEYGRFFLATLGHALTHRYNRVVVANPPDFLVFAVAPQRMLGARIVLDIHDLMTDLFALRMGEDGLPMRALAVLERASLRYADALITVHAPYSREVSERAGGAPVAVVMNSADDRVFTRGIDSTSSPAFMFHGSLFERNGLFELVDAFARVVAKHPDAQLWLVGDGDARAKLRATVTRRRLEGNVMFSDGMRPLEEVASKLRRASFCVVPNRPDLHNRKALSCKALESACCGVPLIAGDLPVLRQHFNDDEVLYFRAGDADALGDAMEHALGHREEMERRAERARERYERNYAWPAQAQRFLAVLDHGCH